MTMSGAVLDWFSVIKSIQQPRVVQTVVKNQASDGFALVVGCHHVPLLHIP